MSIRLNDLKNIATIVKTKYGFNLHKMNFIFCFKKDFNSYFIFQEIQGMPIKRLVYHEENNSVTFVSSWSSWSNPYAMVVDANFEKIENWKDLQDRSRPYNSYIEEGGFHTSYWESVSRKNKTDKIKKHKNKSDTFVEFRIDKIQRANFNKWGFELYSPTISMIGFDTKHNFPYSVHDVGEQNIIYGFTQGSGPPVDEDGILRYKTTWQGGSFHVPEFENSGEISQVSDPTGLPGGQNCDLSSYWDINEFNEENKAFDEEIANIILPDREDDDTIFDVGQKKVDLYFD